LKYAIPEIEKRGGGSVIITSSIAGVKGFPAVPAYSATKHGLIGLMRTAAIDYGPVGIRVNTIHPGPIETKMIHDLAAGFFPDDPSKGQTALTGATLLKRYGDAKEVARIMLFLASDESRYCTGSIYMVDGGMNLG
jgi:NAD(P)-dependent dehydrogenase (short-subunit alcohol dehydrogenase family)